jgi:teichuronic acid biosynthesis glycosyltransferase TuaC
VRILVVTNMYPSPATPGGGVYVAQQVESLRATGLDVEVLHFDRANQGPRAYSEVGRRIRQVVQQVQPELVHVVYGGVMAYLAVRAVRDRPVVVYFRGSDLLGSPAEPLVRRLAIQLGVLASRRAARRAAGATVDSQNLRAALPRGAANGRVWVVPSGIDLKLFTPLDREECRAQLGWQLNRKYVLFPAAPTRREKRFELAEAAISHLRKAGCDADLRVLDGVPHKDVVTWINASDVVLLTSTHEGSPNAVKEALACNVPVVAVDVGDVRERLEQVPGCYVAAPAVTDVADKLRVALSTSRRVEGRRTLQELSLERTAEKLSDIYRRVLEETNIRSTGDDDAVRGLSREAAHR